MVSIRRHWLAVILAVVAGTGGGFYLGHSGPKTYQATSESLVTIPAAPNAPEQLSAAQLGANYVQTYAQVATSLPVAQRIVDQLGLSQTAQSVASQLTAVPQNATYIIDISAKADAPVLAKQLADAAANGLQAEVAQLQSGNRQKVTAQVLQLATLPQAAIAPRPALDLTVGILLGLIVGCATAQTLESLDGTIRSQVVAEEILESPMLGLVPRRSAEEDIVVGQPGKGAAGEPYRSLRTSLRFIEPDSPLQTLLVTSATPDDGKSTTAANLALAMALAGENVILVDGDLRRGGLSHLLGLESAVGVTSVVIGQVAVEDALQTYGRALRVLSTGRLPPNPSEILGSQVFNQLLSQLSSMADIVIIDAPPVLPVADAVALAVQADGVLMVVRHSVTQRAAAAEARRRLAAVGAKIIGHVLNAVPPSVTRNYYADYSYVETPLPLTQPDVSRN